VVGVIVLFLVAVIVAIVGLFAAASVSVQTSVSPPRPARAFALPNLVGLQACHARRIALGAGLRVQSIPQGRCHAIVIHQSPGPHQMIPFRQRKRITVTFRLRS